MKFGVKEVMDVTFYSLLDFKPVLFLDSLKLSTLENTAESVSARGGKSNPKLLTWDFGREATMQVQDALMSLKSLSILAGSNGVVDEGTALIHKRESLVVATNKVTLEETPVGPIYVYSLTDGVEGAELALTTGYTLAGKDVTIVAGAANGTSVAVFYQYSVTGAKTITINSNTFPGYYKIVGDTVIRNATTGQDEAFQMVIPKAKIQPGFTMSFQAEGDPTVFDMNLEVFKPTNETAMVKMIKY